MFHKYATLDKNGKILEKYILKNTRRFDLCRLKEIYLFEKFQWAELDKEGNIVKYEPIPVYVMRKKKPKDY